jgi:tetratricopeptide (TPR) repeat protein
LAAARAASARAAASFPSPNTTNRVDPTDMQIFLATALTLLAATPAIAARGDQSPAQRAIAAARKAIESGPELYRSYDDLALALARRARETADPEFYEEARRAVGRSLELQPLGFQARKLEVWILLGQHEFESALAQARELNKRAPDDVLVYGFIVDAAVELGLYEEAEQACQWMLDLRPGNVPAMTRAAYLREIFGDVEGAIDLLRSVFHSIRSTETEDQAWVLVQVAHLEQSVGRYATAAETLKHARTLFPDYHYALAELAKVRTALGEHAQAAKLLRRRCELAPHPENLFDLACALHRAGELEQAAQAFADFERGARAEMEKNDNANRELIAYYSDEEWKDVRSGPHGPEEALRIAEREIARRKDVHTRAVYAKALASVGRPAEAREQVDAALQVGIRDVGMLFLAGTLAIESGDLEGARERLEACLAQNSESRYAERAEAILAGLPAPERKKHDSEGSGAGD